MVQHALAYARRGWRIFPVARDKRPLTLNGFRDATADLDQIRRWYADHLDAGIGWAIPVDLFVLDIDARHRGHDSLDELEREHGRLPATATQVTGGGGLHLIFRAPRGIELRQLSGLRDGVDTRVGGRGYIVVPPSIHLSGLPYAWSKRIPPAPAPAWLIEMLRVTPAPAATTYVPQTLPEPKDRRERYAQAVLVGEAKAVAETGEGSRNDRLNKAWFRCAQFRDVLSREDVARELTVAAIAAGLEQREIDQVLR